MLRRWNFFLVLLTFLLTIFGTFLTRSGVVASVHAFSQSAIGPALLGFFTVVLVGVLELLGVLVALRLHGVRTLHVRRLLLVV